MVKAKKPAIEVVDNPVVISWSEISCCIWQGSVTRDGYGLSDVGDLYNDGKRHRTLAHRAVFMREYGLLHPDVTLHHLCENKLCVEIRHLIPESRSEHSRHHATRTVCVRGHDRTDPANIWTDIQGHAHCRACWTPRRMGL